MNLESIFEINTTLRKPKTVLLWKNQLNYFLKCPNEYNVISKKKWLLSVSTARCTAFCWHQSVLKQIEWVLMSFLKKRTFQALLLFVKVGLHILCAKTSPFNKFSCDENWICIKNWSKNPFPDFHAYCFF